MLTHLLRILRESIKAVPAMKYALAVAGLLAVVAMAGAFKLSPSTAVLGTVITLVLMVAMVIFARLTKTAPRHFLLPVKIMMWAFLVVTVATACLLFTSAFFQWPRGLRELFDPAPPGRPTADTKAGATDVSPLVAAARQRSAAQDHASAWSMIERALAQAPDSRPAREAQVDLALVALRELRIRPPQTFIAASAPLLECLQLALPTAKGARAADIQAHLGWGKFLRYKETQADTGIAADYAAAVTFDAANPFAHAFWGHWIAWRHGPYPEIKSHFAAALQSGRERGFVQDLRVAAFRVRQGSEDARELLLLADDLRRGNEEIPAANRKYIFWEVYDVWGRRQEPELLKVLTPADHLATFRWLVQGRDLSSSAVDQYFLARLTEAAGDLASAAQLYRPQLGTGSVFEEQIKAGLARCERTGRP